MSKVFAVCNICSFSCFVGSDGDCVFPTQATFSCKCFQESCYFPGKGDLGTKIRLLCSQRTPFEVGAWPEPVPCGKEGVPGGLLLSQHRLILQEVCAPDCRVSPWLFMPAGSTASSPSTAHKL